MKILYIHQYFKTPEEGGSTRSYELAKGLVELGHEVQMITCHNKIKGKRNIDGIHVNYLRIPYRNDFGFIKRVSAFLRFVLQSKKVAKKYRHFDLAYVMTTPLTTGMIALHLENRYGMPYVFEVGDLWPEAPIQMRAIKNPWLIMKLKAFEKKCYENASMIVALSPAIAESIQSVVPGNKISIIPNLSDCDYFLPVQTNNKILQIGYFGTFGRANGLDQLINLAKYLDEKSFSVQFNLMGEGAEEESLRRRSGTSNNVRFVTFAGKEEVKNQMERMDAVYISYQQLPVLTTGSPNKLFDGLAAGKLIIINFKGWIKNLIEENECGFYYDPMNPESFIEKTNLLIADPDLLARHKENARKLAEKSFEKKLLVSRLHDLVKTAI